MTTTSRALPARTFPPRVLPGRDDCGWPRRILHITEAPLGGVVSCLEELLHGQVARARAGELDGIEVITPEINLTVLAGADESPGDDPGAAPLLRFTPYAHRRGGLLPLLALGWLTVTRARATQPDVLHVHSSIAGAVVRLCAPVLPRQTRVVYCPHGWSFVRHGSRWKNRVLGQAERLLSLVTDRVVCVSAAERRAAIAVGIAARKLTVIENGIRLKPPGAAAGPAPADAEEAGAPKRLVFAGRLDAQKGFDTFLEVLCRLGPEAQGRVVGRAIVSGEGPGAPLPPNVEMLGWQPRESVAALCATADALVMPSRWEGFPMVALEAMRAGTAVYASRVGGLADIIVDGETGRLFEPDDAGAMADAIRETGRATFRRQGRASRARFEALYTAGTMDRRVWELYCELCASRVRLTDLRRFLRT